MAQVDSYTLTEKNTSDRVQFACKMSEKSLRLGHEIFINTDSAQEAQKIDAQSGSFRAGSFTPHRFSDKNPADDPAVAGLSHQGFHDLVSTPGTTVNDSVNDSQQPARDRYRFYREQGRPLKSHELTG